MSYFSGLVLNHDHPPDLCPLSSWDYRHEPPVLGGLFILKKYSLTRIDACLLSFSIQLFSLLHRNNHLPYFDLNFTDSFLGWVVTYAYY
jgi:hypothetical protein